MNIREAYRTWWAKALSKETPRDCTVVMIEEWVQDMSIRRSGVWDRVINCDSPREGCLWDLGIAVFYYTFLGSIWSGRWEPKLWC
jgi:hypothetical protein